MARHTYKRTALYTAADRRTTNQVSAWRAELGSRPTRTTHATASRHPCDDVARVGRVGEDVTMMLRGNCSGGIPAFGGSDFAGAELKRPRNLRRPLRAGVCQPASRATFVISRPSLHGGRETPASREMKLMQSDRVRTSTLYVGFYATPATA